MSAQTKAYWNALLLTGYVPTQADFVDLVDSWQDTGTNTDWQDGGAIGLTATGGGAAKGTTSRDKVFWRRRGDSMEARFEYRQTVGGTDGTGKYLFEVPDAQQVDTAKIETESATASVGRCGAGYGVAYIAAAQGTIGVGVHDATHLFLYAPNLGGGPVPGVGFFPLSNAALGFYFTVSIPIVGWTA